MGDWSHLPRELLDAIALLLPSDIDVMRFRSVCTSWRSSVSSYPLLYQLPNCVPIHPDDFHTRKYRSNIEIYYLSRRLVVRVSLPQNEQIRNSETSSESWLIKLQQDDDVPNVFHLLNPLNGCPIVPLPTTIPKIFNSMNFQISVLGQEFVLQTENKVYGSKDGKIAFSSNPPWAIGHNYVIMSIHAPCHLAVFRSVDNSWTIVDDRLYLWFDVIFYKGEFYAVDQDGRAVTVNSSLIVTDIVAPFFGGRKKYLIESNGELLLVDMYPGPDFHIDIGNWFRVYKLGEGGRQWVEVKSLGDRVLFVADNCSFSASAHDLSGCKGNCIYYTNKFFSYDREYEVGAFKNEDLRIFNLESGDMGLLMSHPDHSKSFWPPPAWISTYNTSGEF